jgi:hypothetical protein
MYTFDKRMEVFNVTLAKRLAKLQRDYQMDKEAQTRSSVNSIKGCHSFSRRAW